MTVNELIEKLLTLPKDAEVRITIPINSEYGVNSPANDVRYDEIGPLHYIEII